MLLLSAWAIITDHFDQGANREDILVHPHSVLSGSNEPQPEELNWILDVRDIPYTGQSFMCTTYNRTPYGVATILVYTLNATGACASPENFDAETGKSAARNNAVKKIWSLLGYSLREKQHLESTTTTEGLKNGNKSSRTTD